MEITHSSMAQTTSLSDTEFKDELASAIPHLRAFARNLCGNKDTADDLVQETMLKAWAARGRFEAGTNFQAWTFTILRNYYFSQCRRGRFTGEWDDTVAERRLAAPASQDKIIELRDMTRALKQLPAHQREALILVGAGGLSYEDAAEITGVPVGTIKSRVGRARAALEAILNGGILQTRRAEHADENDAVVSIISYLEELQKRRPAAARRNRPDALYIAA